MSGSLLGLGGWLLLASIFPPATTDGPAGCEIWTELSAVRVMPDATPAHGFGSSLRRSASAAVSLAANERESFQIVLRCATNTTATIAMSPLRSGTSGQEVAGGAAAPGLELTWAQVGYVYAGCMRNSTSFGCHQPQHHWWPDPVVPVPKATLLAGWSHPLIVTVNATAQADPGSYSSAITLSPSAGEALTVRLDVTVFGFVLPVEMRLKAFSDLDEPGLVALYTNKSKAQIHELYLEWGDYLLDHIRINPGTFYLPEPIPVEDVARWREHGLNFFTVASTRSCNPALNDTCELDPLKPGLMNETMGLIERIRPTIEELRRRGWMNMSSICKRDLPLSRFARTCVANVIFPFQTASMSRPRRRL